MSFLRDRGSLTILDPVLERVPTLRVLEPVEHPQSGWRKHHRPQAHGLITQGTRKTVHLEHPLQQGAPEHPARPSARKPGSDDRPGVLVV